MGACCSLPFVGELFGPSLPVEGGRFVHHNNVSKLRELYNLSHSTLLGQGSFGSVATVRKRSSGEAFAMKTISLSGKEREERSRVLSEVHIHARLDHPNICRLYETFLDEDTAELHLIMELCTGGTLVSWMSRRGSSSEHATAQALHKLRDALHYCHTNGVVHRDIKLSNLILENESEDAELKMIDFGIAASSGEWSSSGGTVDFMAPELWHGGEGRAEPSADMWAVGVLTYMLLGGQRPFPRQRLRGGRGSSVTGGSRTDGRARAPPPPLPPLLFPQAQWRHLSADAKDFCRALLCERPSQRLTAEEARSHRWMEEACGSAARGHAKKGASDALRGLQAYCEADDLKKVALQALAFSTPPQKLSRLRDAFREMDADGSGTISRDEFVMAAMRDGAFVSVAKAQQAFNAIDLDRSGEIDYTEFVGATLASRDLTKPSLLAAFSALDRDGDGFVTRQELQHALHGSSFTRDDIERMLAHGDCSGNGRLSFAQFKSALLSGEKHGTNHGALSSAVSRLMRPIEAAGGGLKAAGGHLKAAGKSGIAAIDRGLDYLVDGDCGDEAEFVDIELSPPGRGGGSSGRSRRGERAGGGAGVGHAGRNEEQRKKQGGRQANESPPSRLGGFSFDSFGFGMGGGSTQTETRGRGKAKNATGRMGAMLSSVLPASSSSGSGRQKRKGKGGIFGRR